MKILSRYLARDMLAATTLVFVAVMALFALLDFIQELGAVRAGGFNLAQAALVVALNVPGHVYEVVPIAALVGSLVVLSRLVANSEFAVMQTSGYSLWRAAGVMSLVGMAFALFALVNGEYLAPQTEQGAQQLRLMANHQLVAQRFRSGLWFRDDGAFVNVREILPDARLQGVYIYQFDPNWNLTAVTQAQSGRWLGKQDWRLRQVTIARFGADGVALSHLPDLRWHSVLSPDIVDVLLVAPEKMSAHTLIEYIRHLKANHQRANRYEIALCSKLLFPLTIPVMMLLAMPFALHRPRAENLGARVLLGILAGLAFYLSNGFFGHVGLLDDWPPALTAVTPLAAFFLLALMGLKWVQRR